MFFHTLDTTILKNFEDEFIKESIFSKDFSSAFHSSDDDYVYQLECPGFSKEDIEIEIEDNYLFVEGVTDVLGNPKEISYKFTISKSIDKEKITAEVTNGILFINLPKKKENDLKRKIEIK